MNKYKINFSFDHTKNINDILIRVLKKEIRNLHESLQGKEIKR